MKPDLVKCHDIDGKSYEVDSNSLEFRPAVYGVAVDHQSVLLSPQWDGYDYTGGGVKLGERLADALKREFWEETGYQVELGPLLHVNDSFFKLPFSGRFVHSIHIFYQCQIVGGELSSRHLDQHEQQYVSQAEWVELSTIDHIVFKNSADNRQVLSSFI